MCATREENDDTEREIMSQCERMRKNEMKSLGEHVNDEES